MLGDFQIIRQIGKGPLGTSYLGEHRFIKKRFALKVLPEELMSDQVFVKRFEKEIGKFAMLEHLNLVKVHNISSDQGVFFIVSDYIADGHGESKNISQFLAGLEERLSQTQIVSILRQIAYALDYIHSKNFEGRPLFHGGLKLNNILMGKSLESVPHFYLSDGGLGYVIGQGRILTRAFAAVMQTLEIDPKIIGLEGDRLYSHQEVEKTKLNKLHRSFLQNYAFLAPEQKLGGKFEASAKSDVYAFGVLAYFLLMGHLPEGNYALPSKNISNFSYNWDLLIDATLHQNPEDRPDNLTSLLEEITKKELREVERSIEKVRPVEKRVETSKKERISSFEQYLTTPVPPRVSPIQKNVRPSEEEYEEEGIGSVAVLDELQPVIKPPEFKKHEYEENPGAIFEMPKVVVPYRPKEKSVAEIEPLACSMVMIEGGECLRGSNAGARDEKPRHKVFIRPFALDVHPITNEQFVRFLEVMGGEKDSNNNDMIFLKESRIKRPGGKLNIESGYARHPVVGVSWYGACAYAKWVGKRLPTEAEWELAASSGFEENIYPYGAKIERTQANFFSADTTPVMSYPPNAYGLFDMAGNVYEWCEDWYSYNYYEHSQTEPDNPKGPQQGVYRVLRGGCWKSLVDDLRCAHRHRNNPGTMNRTSGFRLAADVA